ncbi:hypothetical protein GJ200_01960 [Salmonella enterica subsp. enterica]|nr:hypothetical protein [Salmonella enterica]EBF8127867.1 hypothetical protein [Salmonella enterica subsp. enterica]EBG5096010.1 hypothetical protein [Salmonella enterica subsp. enterica serovar India]EBU7939268.1 hypothetical protein [Salmonella enterica subsp. enterica serovar Chittagong]EBY5127483.1 hypothetical protein [Salmonella enterica subsp. enterica serovar Brazzaville]EDH3991055.1 hypothetical protein [Salmonella enterica subsp. enterica serovar Westminster]EDN7242855.1 hypothetica
MKNYQTWLLSDTSHGINIYDYFDEEKVWVFIHGENMEDVTLTIHDGDLTINTVADLPVNTEVLLVKGDLTINDNLTLVGYYPAPNTLGGLIVCGDFKCKNMHLSWGDIVVMGNAYIEEYIFSFSPQFEQGSFDVRGEIPSPYIFIGDEFNPSFYFNNNERACRLTIFTRSKIAPDEMEFTSNPKMHLVDVFTGKEESNTEIKFAAITTDGESAEFTPSSFYRYCKKNRYTTNLMHPVWDDEAPV